MTRAFQFSLGSCCYSLIFFFFPSTLKLGCTRFVIPWTGKSNFFFFCFWRCRREWSALFLNSDWLDYLISQFRAHHPIIIFRGKKNHLLLLLFFCTYAVFVSTLIILVKYTNLCICVWSFAFCSFFFSSSINRGWNSIIQLRFPCILMTRSAKS